jgi:hypothetical protein
MSKKRFLQYFLILLSQLGQLVYAVATSSPGKTQKQGERGSSQAVEQEELVTGFLALIS